jgi:Uma2 family endonuclease
MTIAPELLQLFDDFDADLRPGYRAELVAGEIIVNPPPKGVHETVFSRINRQLVLKSAIVVDIATGRGIQTPHGRYIPDMTVAEPDSMYDDLSWGTTAGVHMLVEITSSRLNVDREAKRLAYAAAGVPLYLLVDRGNAESVLFSSPDTEAQDYRDDVRVHFGADLELPAPFSFKLTDFIPGA